MNPHIPPPGSLAGQVALVTGATSGLGEATALALAQGGATVIFGIRNPDKGDKTAAKIRAKCPDAKIVYPPDVPILQNTKPDSVRTFAAAIVRRGQPLNILINNAGASRLPEWHTPEGVVSLAQSNYLSAWQLTYELMDLLISSNARVINVSSMTARSTVIQDPHAFLTKYWASWYKHTKLALTFHAFELQRRYGHLGLTACALDPGGVNTGIWQDTIFDKPPVKQIINELYAPPEDAALIVIHAATVPWEQEAPPGVSPNEDLRFYARGLNASPLITYLDWSLSSWISLPKWSLGGTLALINTMLDYPIRNRSGGRLCSTVEVVPAPAQAYDKDMSRKLWEASASIIKVNPHAAQAPQPPLTAQQHQAQMASQAAAPELSSVPAPIPAPPTAPLITDVLPTPPVLGHSDPAHQAAPQLRGGAHDSGATVGREIVSPPTPPLAITPVTTAEALPEKQGSAMETSTPPELAPPTPTTTGGKPRPSSVAPEGASGRPPGQGRSAVPPAPGTTTAPLRSPTPPEMVGPTSTSSGVGKKQSKSGKGHHKSGTAATTAGPSPLSTGAGERSPVHKGRQQQQQQPPLPVTAPPLSHTAPARAGGGGGAGPSPLSVGATAGRSVPISEMDAAIMVPW